MGWLSKVLGIDRQRENAERTYNQAQQNADRAKAQADQQHKETMAREEAHRTALRNIEANGKQINDMNNAIAGQRNSSNVIAGGIAGALSSLKKKKPGTTTSSVLGINI